MKLASAVVAVSVLTAAPAVAQVQAPAAPPTPAQVQARRAIATLEGALENAVESGARMLDQRLQASTAANMVMLAGIARARGFRLDDYGLVFDVEFPSMRRSMVWSLEQLERGTPGKGGRVAATTAAPMSAIKPQEIYLNEIANALANAIVEHSGPVAVSANEWLTVAARESVDRGFVSGDPNDNGMTIILRVKGSDLAALRERKLTREDVRKRVEIKRY